MCLQRVDADGPLHVPALRGETSLIDELRAALRGASSIDASVSPHPFGLLVMGVLAIVVFVGLVRPHPNY